MPYIMSRDNNFGQILGAIKKKLYLCRQKRCHDILYFEKDGDISVS